MVSAVSMAMLPWKQQRLPGSRQMNEDPSLGGGKEVGRRLDMRGCLP